MAKAAERPDGFSRRPEELPNVEMWRIVRCPASGKLVGTILSHDLIGRYTHFYRGRSQPCLHPDTCEPCQANSPRRYHSWFAAQLDNSLENVIVEVTMRAVSYFDVQFRQHRTLRGMRFELLRVPQGKANGKLLARLKHQDALDTLQRTPNIAQILMRMWEMNITVKLPEQPLKTLRPLPGQKEFLA